MPREGTGKLSCIIPRPGMSRARSTNADRARDYTQVALNPSGDCVVLGAYNTLQILLYNHQRGSWEDAGHKKIENLYAVSALEWKPDGSTLVVGNVAGCVDCWEACVKKVN